MFHRWKHVSRASGLDEVKKDLLNPPAPCWILGVVLYRCRLPQRFSGLPGCSLLADSQGVGQCGVALGNCTGGRASELDAAVALRLGVAATAACPLLDVAAWTGSFDELGTGFIGGTL